MSPAQHERFLQYLERFTYFGRGDAVRLDRERFAELDSEHQRLLAIGQRSPAEEEALLALRRALLRD
ncbi:MAG: hypothetical protein HYY06_31810 [Deltaproteobacteria bacterium]|nr:hypothetical protein [Deltaproteobacteria bacterium]